MKNRMIPLAYFILLSCLALLMVWALFAIPTGEPRARTGISIVVYGSENSDRWTALEQGIGQACQDLGIERPVVTNARSTDADRLIRLIEREVDNGTNGLLIAVSDSEALAGPLQDIAAGIPVVTIESGLGGELVCIRADDAQMGRDLAQLLSGREGNIAVLAEALERDSVRARYEAFCAEMDRQGTPYSVLHREAQQPLTAYVASSLADTRLSLDTLVILDNETLEVVIDAAPAAMVQTRILGIGSSGKVVHALDDGVVEQILFQNEYAIGYIATMTLADQMGLARNRIDTDIQFDAVRRDTMYTPELERLLFPINQ